MSDKWTKVGSWDEHGDGTVIWDGPALQDGDEIKFKDGAVYRNDGPNIPYCPTVESWDGRGDIDIPYESDEDAARRDMFATLANLERAMEDYANAVERTKQVEDEA